MKTILVIEDTPDMRENIAEILQLAPYQVLQAANGKQGIELARQTRPDLIICDIMMPELDGYGVLHILGKDPALADVPFIFLTAKAELTDFRYGMNLGADDYLTKPFDDHTLLNTVAVRLQKGERGQTEPIQNPVGLDNLTSALLQETDTHQSLCDNYPTAQFSRKHRLFTAGSWPTALYFIRRGKVKLSKTDLSGNEFITILFGAGDFVGYLALLEETVYPETAELLDDSEVCTIPKADFLALIYHNQAVANQFIRLLAGNVAAHQDRLLKLAYQSVRK
ncbi:MAG: response regulator, partial [Cytophagaceae bacterium]